MSVWGKRGSYMMVTATVTFWIVLSAVAKQAEQLIPPAENSLLATDHGGFIRSARFQQVNWRTMDRDVFLESRRVDKPILLVIGAEWSRMQKQYNGIFGVKDVAEALNQRFLTVLVDEVESPEWKGAILPMARIERGDTPWFQMHVLDYDGRVVRSASTRELLSLNDRTFLAFLRDSENLYAEHKETPDGLEQTDEQFALLGGTAAGVASVEDYLEGLLDSVDAEAGGFKNAQIKRLTPQSWRLMFETGEKEALMQSIGPVLVSPMVDLVSGGFFLTVEGREWERVVYAWSLANNAEMMGVLGGMAQESEEGIFELLGQSTFDAVMEVLDHPEWGTYSKAEKGVGDRTLRYCFSRNRLNRLLTQREHEWAEDVLGLDPRVNRQMSPFLRDGGRFVTEGDMRDRVLGKLRKVQHEGKVIYGGIGHVGTRSYAVARLLENAQWLGRAERLDEVLDFAELLRQEMRTGVNDVFGIVRLDESELGGLEDYLSYADMAFEAWKVTGDSDWWEDGRAVLDRAFYLFENSGGWLLVAPKGLTLSGVNRFALPQVWDSEMRSAHSLAIDLAVDYGRSTGDLDDQRFLMGKARRYMGQVGEVLLRVDSGVSGLARSALKLGTWEEAFKSGSLGVDGDAE